ncbi:MAG: hypothetical protein ABH956_01595 [Candidatus Nealsonbacteria bacterium]
MTETKIYCPECEKYVAEIIETKEKQCITDDGIRYKENIVCCKCQICGYSWEMILTVERI